MTEPGYDSEAAPEYRSTRPGPTLYVLLGAIAGLVAGFLVAWAVGGNPLSDANEVDFVELTVASVSEEGDRLCWAEDPQRRDSPLQCAVVALDPTVEVPEEGSRITAGLVDMQAPDGSEVRQIVYVGPVSPQEIDPDGEGEEDGEGGEDASPGG